jgi:hypothetical protein
MDVSATCTWRAYFSSDFDGFFVKTPLGKSLSEKCIAFSCNYFEIKGAKGGNFKFFTFFISFNFNAVFCKMIILWVINGS